MGWKQYRLPVVIRAPSEETEDKYLAEIPALPGCRAWGDTPAQAVEYVQSVATAFIESYRERGQTLPFEPEGDLGDPVDQQVLHSEVVVLG